MQAVNAIGHGAFCLPVKFVTKSLPPQPPCLECIVIGSSSLKLKWRDSRYIDLTQYMLEMERSDGRSEASLYSPVDAILLVGGVAQWLECRSLAGALSLSCSRPAAVG